MSRSTSRPHRVVLQARALLLAADGLANAEIARRCEVDADAVRRWRARFEAEGTAGVGVIAKGRGRKPSLPAGTVGEVLRLTHTEKPADTSTHWSTRSMAARVGIGKDAVAKIWADHNLKPWRVDTTLFAALDVPTGKVIGSCLPKHRHTEFLKFLKVIDTEVPDGLDVLLILDNYATHKRPNVQAWLGKLAGAWDHREAPTGRADRSRGAQGRTCC